MLGCRRCAKHRRPAARGPRCKPSDPRLQPDFSMTLLTVNSGSTSVKLALYEAAPGAEPRLLATEQQSGSTLDAATVLRGLESKLGGTPQVIAHRIVHGGTRFVQPTRIDDAVLRAIGQLSPLAPLHNPVALRWVSASR